jgi:branched-chain amino acid transport system ATP-binding protein
VIGAGRSTEQVLKVQNLNAFYEKIQVTFGVELEIHPGEIVALLGRNGAGKTTTLMAISGIVTTKNSSINLSGKEIAGLPAFRRVRAGLSMTPSGSRAFRSLSVSENLQLSSSATTRRGRWTIEEILDLFPKLRTLFHSQAWQLSGGERQMLAISRALLAQPDVMLLDEPSEGLAPIIVQNLGRTLKQLSREGLAILLTEQNHSLALGIADRVLFMEKGQIAWQGDADSARAPDVISRYLSL